MGVVYKLKPEVVDYIIQHKRDTPKVSCRLLADLASEKFKVTVSKSSVSAILKSASLNSPVGRRSVAGVKEKKFRIPSQKKEKISEDLGKLGFEGAEEEGPHPVAPRPPSAHKKTAPSRPRVVEEPDEDSSTLPLLPDPIAKDIDRREEEKKITEKTNPPKQGEDFFMGAEQEAVEQSEAVSNLRAPQHAPEAAQGPVYDGLGCFFLKAAELDISSCSILGELLRNSAGVRFVHDVDRISGVLVLLEAFGIAELEKVDEYVGQGLWKINDVGTPLSKQDLQNFVDSIENPKMLSLKMSNERPQIFSEISSIRLQLQDKTEFCIDASLYTLWPHNVQSGILAPIKKTISALSQSLVNNSRPAVIFSVPGDTAFDGPLYQLLAAFEGFAGKRIIKISLFDSGMEEVASFVNIPEKKRHFMIGAWPWQKEFKELLKRDLRRIKYFYDEEFGSAIYYSEIEVRLNLMTIAQREGFPLRVIFLRQTLKGDPVAAILTNIPVENMPAHVVVAEYLTRWPNLQAGQQDFAQRLQKFSPLQSGAAWIPGDGNIVLMARTLLHDLSAYAQRHFFSSGEQGIGFDAMRERFYRLPGRLIEGERSLRISLRPPEGYLYLPSLEYAARRINEGSIKDKMGRKVIITIYK